MKLTKIELKRLIQEELETMRLHEETPTQKRPTYMGFDRPDYDKEPETDIPSIKKYQRTRASQGVDYGRSKYAPMDVRGGQDIIFKKLDMLSAKVEQIRLLIQAELGGLGK